MNDSSAVSTLRGGSARLLALGSHKNLRNDFFTHIVKASFSTSPSTQIRKTKKNPTNKQITSWFVKQKTIIRNRIRRQKQRQNGARIGASR